MRVAFFKAPSVSLRLAVRRCQTVLLRMVLEWSFETVTRVEEPAQSYAPPATPASAFTLLTPRVCAAPDGFLLILFSSVAAERRALIVTTKQAYTYVSYAFLSMLEKQTAQERRRVKPHLQHLWGVSRIGDMAELGDLQRWLYFLHPHVGYRNIAVATVSADNQRRFEARTSGFYKKQMEEQWYFQAHGASAHHILYMMYDSATSQWISEYAFYELSMGKDAEIQKKRRLGQIA